LRLVEGLTILHISFKCEFPHSWEVPQDKLETGPASNWPNKMQSK